LIAFNPSEHVRLSSTAISPAFASGQSNLRTALNKERPMALADIELSVQDHLAAWTEQHRHEESASSLLSSCIAEYAAAAQEEYKKNPEELSIMMLTIFALWVALDKVAITHHNMLRDYSPEVPTSLLNPLLLRTASSIEQYRWIQTYIEERHRNARGYSVFDILITESSFSIRYFQNSNELQQLKRKIEQDAEDQKQCKLRELDNKLGTRQSYLDTAERQEHTYTKNRWGYPYHAKWCKKCQNEELARNMKINIHEWPLPADEILAKHITFELQVPTIFQRWRSTTYYILYDLCRPTSEKCDEFEEQLESYSGLLQYVHNTDRITLASSTKSFTRSHYKDILVSEATYNNVALQNGLKFSLYDAKGERWAAHTLLKDCNIYPLCTQQISSKSPYQNLQKFVDSVNHTPNAVIADQSSAPPEVSRAKDVLRVSTEIDLVFS
jgi:hypothetical protein